jgi:hypothetical protein
MQGSGPIAAATGIAVTRWIMRILAAIRVLVGVLVASVGANLAAGTAAMV